MPDSAEGNKNFILKKAFHNQTEDPRGISLQLLHHDVTHRLDGSLHFPSIN